MFDPKTDKYPYPEITDRHYLKIKKDDGTVFDRDFPYIDSSRGFLFRQALVRFLLRAIVFPASYIRMGLEIRGRENLKKHREVIDGGVISCSNHVHLWDYIMIMNAIKPKKPRVLVWAPNIRGENGTLIRLVGGIPIPDSGAEATKAYLAALKKLLDGGWLHIYAEGSMWEFYQPIRPFKRGAAYLACELDKPILPMAFSYREPGFIRKNIFRQEARFTLNIGEPVFPDKSLPRSKRMNDLTRRAHEAVCRLAGMEPGENPYPPIFKENRRADY